MKMVFNRYIHISNCISGETSVCLKLPFALNELNLIVFGLWEETKHLEKNHVCTEKTCKLHTERRGGEPVTSL